MQNKILITGGFGTLGSYVTKYFLKLGYKVYVTSSSTNKIPDLFLGVKVIPLDLMNPFAGSDQINKLKFDIVIHLASYNEYLDKNYYWQSYRVNTEGTSSLINNLNLDNLKHFVYLSTYHVYGKNEGFINEDLVPKPLNDYAVSHLAAEFIVRQHSISSALPATIIRLTNSYGCPINKNKINKNLLLNDLALMALKEDKLTLKSAPNIRRDFICMSDVAKALQEITVYGKPKVSGQIFNLSYGKSISLLDAAKEIRKAYLIYKGKKINIEYTKDFKKKDNLIIDSSSIYKLLSFKPKFRIVEEALKTFKLIEG